EVEGVRQDVPPKFTDIRYVLELVTDEADERLELLHKNIRKYGTITNTLAEACNLDGELTRVDSIDEL
ncbi:MAG: OsmC family protein, partial [Persicimonas sp.]